MFVESFIIIAMASFYLAIVSRCSRFNTLMLNPQPLTRKVIRGRWDLSHRDSLLPSNRLFQRIREAFETLYLRQIKATELPLRQVLNSVIVGIQSMWQVADVLWYTIHEKTPFFDGCVRTNHIKVSSFLVLKSHIYCNATKLLEESPFYS